MKSKEETIREIISDDFKIVAAIKQAPQTYNSILQHCKDCGTMQVVLRRRIKRLLKEHEVWKMRVPGTRFGLALFCTPEHSYKILVFQGLMSVRVFYMYDYKQTNNMLTLENYWELKGPNWSRWVYTDVPFEIPKYQTRDGVFRLWE